MRIDGDVLAEHFKLARPGAANLFAYPAQSNFSGVQHSLEWISQPQARGWDVLLDTAAFVPTNYLKLNQWHPDFVSISFYKMSGYPTGVGCLLASRSALSKLRRPWFSGGTITVASVQGDRYFMAEGASAFEDEPPDFLAIPAVEIWLQHLEKVGLDLVHTRCRYLTAWAIHQLLSLHHANGHPLARVYGPLNDVQRGATIAMNFYNPSEKIIDHRRVEEAASKRQISLRSGCFCNPGGGETALRLSKSELIGCFRQHGEANSRFTKEDFRHCVDSKGTGAVRISLGIVSNFEDARRFVASPLPSEVLINPERLTKLLQTPSGEQPMLIHVGFHMLYTQGHIPGSEYIGPASQQDTLEKFRRRVEQLPRKKSIALYCGCCPWDHCPTVSSAYEALHSMGFSGVRVLYIPNNFGRDWIEKGYPVEKGQ